MGCRRQSVRGQTLGLLEKCLGGPPLPAMICRGCTSIDNPNVSNQRKMVRGVVPCSGREKLPSGGRGRGLANSTRTSLLRGSKRKNWSDVGGERQNRKVP